MLFRSVEDNKGLFVFESSAVSYIETVFTGITLCNIVEEKQYYRIPLLCVPAMQNLIPQRFYQTINYLLRPYCIKPKTWCLFKKNLSDVFYKL